MLDWFDHKSTESMAVRARNPENLARIKFGADIWNAILGWRELIDGWSANYYAPYFCPNGLTPTLPYFRKMSLEAGIFHERYIRLLDNGAISVGNSLTQFQIIVADMVKAEMSRIISYSEKGDIARYPR